MALPQTPVLPKVSEFWHKQTEIPFHLSPIWPPIQNLGFLINWKAAHLVPTQSFQWIGLKWMSCSSSLSLSASMRLGVLHAVRQLLSHPLTSRCLECVLGKLQYASIVDLLCRSLLKEDNLFLHPYTKNKLKYKKVRPPRLLKLMEQWFVVKPIRKRAPGRAPFPSLNVHMDVSLQGCLKIRDLVDILSVSSSSEEEPSSNHLPHGRSHQYVSKPVNL